MERENSCGSICFLQDEIRRCIVIYCDQFGQGISSRFVIQRPIPVHLIFGKAVQNVKLIGQHGCTS